MRQNESLKNLGCVTLPSLDDIIIFQNDEEFNMEAELSSNDILKHKEPIKQTTFIELSLPIPQKNINGEITSPSKQGRLLPSN